MVFTQSHAQVRVSTKAEHQWVRNDALGDSNDRPELMLDDVHASRERNSEARREVVTVVIASFRMVQLVCRTP
jgi:hypothetical protein